MNNQELNQYIKDNHNNVATDRMLELEVEKNNIEVVKLLILRYKKKFENFGWLIQSSAEFGFLELTQYLLKDKYNNPNHGNDYALRFASSNGHIEIVKLLLKDKRVDPSSLESLAICRASEAGHLDIVKLLLEHPKTIITSRNNWAIRMSFQNNHTEITKLLFNYKKVRELLQYEYLDIYNQLMKYEIQTKIERF
jgi:ankyrin repeat protein